MSIGIQDTVPQLLEKIQTELDAGYQRIKMKIKPGWDVDVIRQVRERFPSIRLMADANSAYDTAGATVHDHAVWFLWPNMALMRYPGRGNFMVWRFIPDGPERTREEFDAVHIPGSEFLTQELMHELGGWPKEQLIVFVCHHGIRSLDAASYFAGHGLENVRSLSGGIDAWSIEVDSSLPRYELA